VFQRLNGVWTQQAELFSPNPNVHDNFGGQQGNSIAGGVGLIGDTIVVADAGNFQVNIPGGIDVFTRINGTWTFTTQLTVPGDFSFFPNSLAFGRKALVVGSNFSDAPSAPFAGVAYVFQFKDGQWSAPVTLAADDATSGAQFGNGVGLSGNVIVVGANFASGATSQSGAAYIFAREGDSWRQKAKLMASDGQDFDQFGVTIAVSGQTVFVSASNHTPPVADATAGGAAYVFRHRDGGWQQTDELFASDAIGGGDFGASVAIQNNTLIVGADGQHPTVEGYPGGEAYVFSLNPE
jgi:FG-GAP repeat